MLKNNLLIKALNGEDVVRPPVWLMRQAGRTLKEYRELRMHAGSFIALVKNPELASVATIQPVDVLGVDAAILFSDILVVPESMGLPYRMEENKGPFFPKKIASGSDVDALKVARLEDYGYVPEAIRLTLKKLRHRVPLIGFCGAPWTLFAYMTEGKASRTFSEAKRFLFCEPKASQKLLEMITQSCVHYLKDQIRAGVHAVQIFDSWAGVLGPQHYQKYILPFLKILVDEIRSLAPLILFCKDAHHSLGELASIKPHALGLDWTISPQLARTICGDDITLQGNLDPCILYAPDDILEKETKAMLHAFGKKRYICNLGHGVYPDVDVNKIKLFIHTVKTAMPE